MRTILKYIIFTLVFTPLYAIENNKSIVELHLVEQGKTLNQLIPKEILKDIK